jgi:hypothetical protein
MVSEARVRKLVVFAKKIRLHYREVNQRPWGSFEAVLSLNGHQWFHTGEPFGWGWSPFQVVAELFNRHRHEPAFQHWFGYNNLMELNQIFNEPDPPMNAPPVLTEDIK